LKASADASAEHHRVTSGCTQLLSLDRGLLPGLRPALATLNRKDFQDFAEHEGLKLVGI
jgi:hypothetical protein